MVWPGYSRSHVTKKYCKMATTESMETGVGEVNGDDRGTEEESMDVDGEVEEPQEQTK